MIGDLPEADSKPPSNMLFIAKLNQVTTEEDLETIFSRFGNITSCDIIRDKKTGDSLCYAFLGYDTDEACENAYFKMNNVLIDDRRIKVLAQDSFVQLCCIACNTQSSNETVMLKHSFRAKCCSSCSHSHSQRHHACMLYQLQKRVQFYIVYT